MDTIHSALFYLLGAIALASALTAALATGRRTALAALFLLALATGLLLADLSAGFAALLVFVLLASAGFAAATATGPAETAGWRQAGGIVAALAFAAFAYAAYRGAYHSTGFPGGSFDASALGRHLLAHDPLGLIALGAAVLIGTGLAVRPAGRAR